MDPYERNRVFCGLGCFSIFYSETLEERRRRVTGYAEGNGDNEPADGR